MSILAVNNLSLKRSNFCLSGISFSLQTGNILYITGDSASGKSSLLLAIKNGAYTTAGSIRRPEDHEIVLIEDKNRLKDKSGQSDFYYQQRFDAAFANDSKTVIEELRSHDGIDIQQITELLEKFKISNLVNQHLIKLSNGEGKKIQIVKALLKKPKLLLLDNPFAGLDAGTNLVEFFNQLCVDGVSLIIACRPSQLAANPENVLELKNGKSQLWNNFSYSPPKKISTEFQLSPATYTSERAIVELKNINICYDNRSILNNFSWRVRPGEKWLLKGPNGAGKSTILSLINADNPQVYSNQVFVFGIKRGSGESIWDVKKRIGFFSPELHLCFDLSLTAAATIASGLTDSFNSIKKSEPHSDQINAMLNILSLSDAKDLPLYELTFSQQRLLLLGRAMIKNPDLLIFDEPCQGLDEIQIRRIKDLTNSLSAKTTLIYVTHVTEEIPESINCMLEIRAGETIQICRACQ